MEVLGERYVVIVMTYRGGEVKGQASHESHPKERINQRRSRGYSRRLPSDIGRMEAHRWEVGGGGSLGAV